MPKSFASGKAPTGAGTGDVVGPVSSTDNAIARWNGTAGDTLQDSAAFVDDNGNVYAPNLANGYATTATAAGTTTLTVASKGVQTFTGATTQTVTLPVVSTLPQIGFGYWIINNSSGAVTVNSSGGNAVQVVAAGGRVLVVANALAGTSAAIWDKVYWLAASGDVTASGTLTSNAVMLGGGTTVVKAVAGIITDGTSKLTLGVEGGAVGSIDFKNATSGTLNIAPQAGALGTSNLVAPAVSGTLTVNDAAQTLTTKTIDCDSNTVTNVALTKVDADDTLPATCAKGQIITTDNGKFWHGQGTNDWDQVLKASDIGGVRAVTGTTDTVLSTDFSKMVTYSNASSIAVTLPQAGSGSPAAFVSGFYFDVQNLGAGTVTITPTTSTINGGATLVLLSGQYTTIFSNGTNYVSFMPVNKVNGLTVTNSTGTLTVTNAKTASFSNTITFAGTDGTTATLPPVSAELGYINIPQQSKSADYTFVLADAGYHVYHPGSDNNARAFTIPANASVAYPVGTVLTVINLAATACTVPITSDTMHLAGAGTTGTRTVAQYGIFTAIKVASTLWICNGPGVT